MAMNSKPKIDLDAVEPPTFAWPVKIPTPRGEITITFDFIARSRDELAAWTAEIVARAQREWNEAQQAETPADDAGPFAALTPEEVRASAARQTKADVDAITQIAKGWDLQHPFDADHIGKLCNRYPAAGQAIGRAYRIAHAEGRLGN